MLESDGGVYTERKLFMMLVDYSSLSTTNTTRYMWVYKQKNRSCLTLSIVISTNKTKKKGHLHISRTTISCRYVSVVWIQRKKIWEHNSLSFLRFFSTLFILLIKLRRCGCFFILLLFVQSGVDKQSCITYYLFPEKKNRREEQQQKNTLLGGLEPPAFRLTMNYSKIILYLVCIYFHFCFHSMYNENELFSAERANQLRHKSWNILSEIFLNIIYHSYCIFEMIKWEIYPMMFSRK